MASKKNLLLLLSLALLLVVWYLAVYVFDFRQSSTISGAFPKIIPQEITSIKIFAPANDGIECYLYKKGEEWRVLSRVIDAPIPGERMYTVFEELVKLNATRVAAIDSSKWEELGIADSLATRMILYKNNEVFLDLLLGSFQYKTPSFKPLNPQVKQDTKGITYVRKMGEQRVYSAENFFGPTFNQHSDVWRDQFLLNFDLNQLQKIVVVDKEIKGYEIEINPDGWFIDGNRIADQKIAELASKIRLLRHSVFADGFKPKGEPEFRAIFDLMGSPPVFLDVYFDEMGRVIVNSSSNKETFFYDHDEQILDQVFRPKDFFLK